MALSIDNIKVGDSLLLFCSKMLMGRRLALSAGGSHNGCDGKPGSVYIGVNFIGFNQKKKKSPRPHTQTHNCQYKGNKA